MQTLQVEIPVDYVTLGGILEIPYNARAVVVFVHGSGSSRFSPRNQQVAAGLQHAGFATLLFDLLTLDEQRHDDIDATYRFNIALLARRLGRNPCLAAAKGRCRVAASGAFRREHRRRGGTRRGGGGEHHGHHRV